MKQIQPISLWDKGQNKQADILNAFGTDLQLGKSAEFYYTLSNENEQLTQGKLMLEGEDYLKWDADVFAWDWIAAQLNLTIIGDYVPPVVEPVAEVIAEVTEIPVEPTEAESATQTQPNN